MLSADIHWFVWARQPVDEASFFDCLQAVKDQKYGPSLQTNYQYFPSQPALLDPISMMQQQMAQVVAQQQAQQAAAANTYQIPSLNSAFPSQAAQFGLPAHTTQPSAQPRAATEMEQLMQNMKEMTAHLAQMAGRFSRPRPRPERNLNQASSTTTPYEPRRLICYNCNREGHYASECRQARRPRPPQHVQFQAENSQNRPVNWLDVCSDNEEEEEELQLEYDLDDSEEILDMFPAERNRPQRPHKTGLSESAREERHRRRSGTLTPTATIKERPSQSFEEPISMEQEVTLTVPETKPRVQRPRLMVPLEEEMPPFSIADKLKQVELPLSVAQLLAVAPEVRKQLVQALTPKRIPPPAREVSVASQEPAETTSLSARIQVEGTPVTALIDTGAAISAISYKFLKSLGFEIQQPATYRIKGINGQKITPLGEVRQLPVSFGKVTVPANFAVVDAISYELILGIDWLRKVAANITFGDSPSIEITWLGRKQTTTTKYLNEPSPFQEVEYDAEEEEQEKEDFEVYMMSKSKTKKVNKYPKEEWTDLGQWMPTQPYDQRVQVITGEYCQWCRYRAEDHHCHYLLEKRNEESRPPSPVYHELPESPVTACGYPMNTVWLEPEGWPEYEGEPLPWGEEEAYTLLPIPCQECAYSDPKRGIEIHSEDQRNHVHESGQVVLQDSRHKIHPFSEVCQLTSEDLDTMDINPDLTKNQIHQVQ
jgi:hypothetical protein